MNFNELFEEFDQGNLKNEPKKFVEKFEQNRILIDGQKVESNEIIYDKITQLYCHYAHNLTILESYKEAEINLGKAIILLKGHHNFQDSKLIEVPLYEALIFDRVKVNYWLKKIKEAENDIDLLIENYPKNERYKQWKKAIKIFELNKLETILYYVVAIVIVSQFFVDRSIPFVRNLSIILLVSSLLGISVLNIFKRLWKPI